MTAKGQVNGVATFEWENCKNVRSSDRLDGDRRRWSDTKNTPLTGALTFWRLKSESDSSWRDAAHNAENQAEPAELEKRIVLMIQWLFTENGSEFSASLKVPFSIFPAHLFFFSYWNFIRMRDHFIQGLFRLHFVHFRWNLSHHFRRILKQCRRHCRSSFTWSTLAVFASSTDGYLYLMSFGTCACARRLVARNKWMEFSLLLRRQRCRLFIFCFVDPFPVDFSALFLILCCRSLVSATCVAWAHIVSFLYHILFDVGRFVHCPLMLFELSNAFGFRCVLAGHKKHWIYHFDVDFQVKNK